MIGAAPEEPHTSVAQAAVTVMQCIDCTCYRNGLQEASERESAKSRGSIVPTGSGCLDVQPKVGNDSKYHAKDESD